MAVTLTLYSDEVDHILYLLRTSGCTDTQGTGKSTRTKCQDIERRVEAQIPRFDYEYENPHLNANGDVTNCGGNCCNPPARVETDTERIARLEFQLAKLEKRMNSGSGIQLL